jgi:alcohol dehydrogenase
MKAYRLMDFTGIDGLKAVEEQTPPPVKGEVLVRVRAVSLNFRDLAMTDGRYPVEHHAGLIPVSDAAGEVLAIGEGVTALGVGDRVVNSFHPRWFGGEAPVDEKADQYGSREDGWLTECKVVSQEAVVGISDRLSFEDAATLPCAAVTAWRALHGGSAVRPGQTVLTQGTGGVALFALQIAKLAGATVVATTSSDEKAEVLRGLGADQLINYRANPHWGELAKEWTGGRGVHRVVEVGGSGTLGQSMKALRPEGEVALVGFLAAAPEPSLDFLQLFLSGGTFRVINVGHRGDLIDVARALGQTRVRPVIDSIHPFEDAAEAYRRLASGDAIGKIVISL